MKAETPDMTAVLGDDNACLRKLVPYWRAADIHSSYPATTETVVNVLRQGGGFDVSEELLEQWARRGMVPGVKRRGGRFAWMPQNMLCAAIQADTWRRWIPSDKRHIHKMSAVEIEEAKAVAEGTTMFDDMEQFDINAFVEVIVGANDPAIRATFGVAFKTRLRQLGVLDK